MWNILFYDEMRIDSFIDKIFDGEFIFFLRLNKYIMRIFKFWLFLLCSLVVIGIVILLYKLMINF